MKNNLEIITEVIEFIENNLKRKLSLESISNKVCFSMYYFSKMFKYTVGENINDYIIKRRLTEASKDLIYTNTKILEIAFDYQYNSQESFTKAFKKYFNVNPGYFRKLGKKFELYQKKTLKKEDLIKINGGAKMEPRIIQKEEMKFMGLKYYGKNLNNEIPETFDKFDKIRTEMKSIKNPNTTYGICEVIEGYQEGDVFSYFVCHEVEEIENNKNFESIKIKPQKYVVFTHKGSTEGLINTYKYIYGEWFPKNNYQPVQSHEFEVYDERFTDELDSIMEIWVPIK